MKIIRNTPTSSKFAAQVAARFIEEVQAQTSLDELYKMGQVDYFTDLYSRVAGEPVEFYVLGWRGQDPQLQDPSYLWCGGHKKKCQQAFADQLVKLTQADHEILLAIMTLRPKAWGTISCHENWVHGTRESVAKYFDWSTSTIEIVEYARLFLPHISQPTGNCRDRWVYIDDVQAMRSEMWKQYSLDLNFGEEIRNDTSLKLAKKLTEFIPCKLAYTAAHSGNIGTQLLGQMCLNAKKTDELRFVINSVFDQGEKGLFWKELKPLLRKLLKSLE